MAGLPFTTMPDFQLDVSSVVFADESGNLDTVGGYYEYTNKTKLATASSALQLPVLWNRGSLFNLGRFGSRQQFPGSIPPLNSFAQYCGDQVGGVNALYWDAPRSWGRQNFLLRRPRTLIVQNNCQVPTNISDIGNAVVQAINAAFTSVFAPLNVSVVYLNYDVIGNLSVLTGLMPLSASNTLSADVNVDYSLGWSMPMADEPFFVGGDCYLAVIQDFTFDIWLVQLAVGGGDINPLPLPNISPWTLSTSAGVDQVTGGNYTIGGYVNYAKAANDLAILNAGAAAFNKYKFKQYQYDQNSTTRANLNLYGDATYDIGGNASLSPDPVVPDDVADTFIAGSPYASRQTFTPNQSAGIVDQLLADAKAFFS